LTQIPVAVVASVEDVVVMPDASHIVVTLDVGGPKVDLALEPNLALNLVDACAKGYADALKVKKVPKEQRTLFPASGFEVGENKQRGVIGLTINFGGGHLSFALNDAMADSLFEMLGVVTGRAIPNRQTDPHSAKGVGQRRVELQIKMARLEGYRI
jgi:hypothetical protein